MTVRTRSGQTSSSPQSEKLESQRKRKSQFSITPSAVTKTKRAKPTPHDLKHTAPSPTAATVRGGLPENKSAGEKEKQIYRQTLHSLLSKLTSSSSTICPSQIPRLLHSQLPNQYPDWRHLMDPVREVVWEQVSLGRVEVTQRGEVRDLEEREGIRGPIRVRRGAGFEGWDPGSVD